MIEGQAHSNGQALGTALESCHPLYKKQKESPNMLTIPDIVEMSSGYPQNLGNFGPGAMPLQQLVKDEFCFHAPII